MKVAIILQARMGSTRLPGKTLKPLLGKPFLMHIVERLRLCKNAEKIIVATSIEPKDDAIELFCRSKGIPVFRGSEADVLDRYYRCAKTFDINTIVRITADNPLVDWENIDEMITSHIDKDADITYTEGMPYGTGLGNCVMSFQAIEKVRSIAKENNETPDPDDLILERPEMFKINVLQAHHKLQRNYRLTVDYPEDFQLMEVLFAQFVGIPDLKEVVSFLDNHPEVVAINKNIGKN